MIPTTADGIRQALALETYLPRIQVYNTLDSTNSEAKRRLLDGALGATPSLLVARTQTGGRGRLGRAFHSPADTGLYMTLVYPTVQPLDHAVAVTASAAVAVVRAAETLTGERLTIKWVNDVYRDGAKVCGILTEAVTLPGRTTYMLVGIGINVTTTDFPDGLRAPAGALCTANQKIDINVLAAAVAEQILTLVAQIEAGTPDPNCLAFYRARSLLIGRRVICTRGEEAFEGTAEGIDERYELLIRRDDGMLVALSSGEVSVRVV